MRAPYLPMLATPARPFDSADHLFEIKWDGVRALAAVDGGSWQLWGRERADYRSRYPELDVLQRLPAGTVVDGELVVLAEGCANLPALLRRHQLRQPERIRHAGRQMPIQYVLFDLLCYRGRLLLKEPLTQRRALLAEVVAAVPDPRLVFAPGVLGAGRELFERAVAAGHEGVMAKRLTSRYRPGQRSSAWHKIKPPREWPGLILGYTVGRQGLDSLLVGAVRDGGLRYVGTVTRGWHADQQEDLLRRLAARRCPHALVECPQAALWVAPALYCRLQPVRWTAQGQLRDARFRGLLNPTRSAPATP